MANINGKRKLKKTISWFIQGINCFRFTVQRSKREDYSTRTAFSQTRSNGKFILKKAKQLRAFMGPLSYSLFNFIYFCFRNPRINNKGITLRKGHSGDIKRIKRLLSILAISNAFISGSYRFTTEGFSSKQGRLDRTFAVSAFFAGFIICLFLQRERYAFSDIQPRRRDPQQI